MPEITRDCQICNQPTKGRDLRTWTRRSLRLLVCGQCFLKLIAEDVRNGQSKPKLVRQPLEGEQLKLPF